MLYIVTALYEEAAPFIGFYALKKDTSCTHFDIYSGDTARLLVTRPGAIRAAVAVSAFLTMYPPSGQDCFLCVGVCACPDEKIPAGSMFFIRKITDHATGRTIYPELLFRTPCGEAELTTMPRVLTDLTMLPATDNSRYSSMFFAPQLYDMEACGIYTAASTYFFTHRIFFFKIVSDHITDLPNLNARAHKYDRSTVSGSTSGTASVTDLGTAFDTASGTAFDTASCAGLRSLVTDCIARNLPALTDWLSTVTTCCTQDTAALTVKEAALLEAVAVVLRLSVSSRERLKRLMIYLHLSGREYLAPMKDLLTIPLNEPCRSKKEGLQYLEQLFEHFL